MTQPAQIGSSISASAKLLESAPGLLLAVLLGIGDGLVHALLRPVGAAERPADAAGLDLGVHGVDEFADRHVGVVAVHEVDVDIVGLQPVERLRQLLADDVGIAERAVRALADDAPTARACRGS